VKRLLRIFGTLSLLGVLAWRIEIGEVTRTLSTVGWQWWLAALGCYLFAQVVSSVRWLWLAQPLGFTHSLNAYVGFYFVGNFFNLILPTSIGGDVARAWYLARGTGRGAGAALSVLADRLIGLYVLVALACVVALVQPLPAWVQGWVAVAAAGGVVGLIGLLLARRWQTPFIFQPSEGFEKRSTRWHQLSAALNYYIGSPRLLGWASLLSLVVQLLNVLLVWFVAKAVGAEVSLVYCCVLMPLVTLLTLAPVSVNGMGVREGGTIVLLAPVGVAAEQALTLSLLWFAVSLATGLIGGAWYLFGRLPRCEVRSDAELVCRDSNQGRAGQSPAAA
jgi:uncharacterized membrane protein YbhN (UPF0104 family)